jgi:hypothetical protein
LTDEQRIAIQECIDYLTPAAKEFSDLGLPRMGDSKHARCIRTLRLILAAPAAPAVAPEGCTPADAQMLRAANHQLAAENDYLRRRLRPFAQIASSPLSWAMVEYCVEGDPEKQALQAPQMQRAFNRAADALRENAPSHEPADCEALDLPDWIKNAKPPAPAQAEQQDTNPPFANCSFRICDLPGQCRGEGKCHHPKAEQQGDGAKHECICGDTKALNTVHRTDGPCYRAEQQGDGGAPVTDEQILEDAAEAFGRSREYSNCFAEPSERSLLHFVHKYMGQPSARVELSDVIAMALFDSANKHSFYTFMREAQNILAAHAAQTGESK